MSRTEVDKTVEAFNRTLEGIAKQQKREDARRAALTPNERRIEDNERARKYAADEARELEARIDRAAWPHRGNESMTVKDFGRLLHGVEVGEGFGFIQPRAADPTIELLKSAVGVSLVARNQGVPLNQLRFATADLIAFARRQRLPNVELVASALGFQEQVGRSNVPARASAPNSSKTTGKLNRQELARKREALVREAFEWLLAGWERITGKKPVNPMALPFTMDVLFECFEMLCRMRGVPSIGADRVRKLIPDNYKLADGNRGKVTLRTLNQLRTEIKTIR